MRRRDVAPAGPCGNCGRTDCEAEAADQCAAWAQLAEQRARFGARRSRARSS